MALLADLGHPALPRRLLPLLLALLLSTHTTQASAVIRNTTCPIHWAPKHPPPKALIDTKPWDRPIPGGAQLIQPTHTRPPPQLGNVIGTPIDAEEFNFFVHLLLAASDLYSLPPPATLFAPSDVALPRSLPFHGSLAMLAYHIVPVYLSYADLQLLDVSSRLPPTLLSSHTIVVTDGPPQCLTVDGAVITHPDLYWDGSFAVHGIGSVLPPSGSPPDGPLVDPSEPEPEL